MARGIRYTREFQEKALRLLGESRANHSSETKALASVSQSLGIAPETLRRWRNRADSVLLQCLFDRFGSVFPQCGLMVFPGVVIVSR